MKEIVQALQEIVDTRNLSLEAAGRLESIIAERYSEDPRFSDLEHILASYRPRGGAFLYGEDALVRECAYVLKVLSSDKDSD